MAAMSSTSAPTAAAGGELTANTEAQSQQQDQQAKQQEQQQPFDYMLGEEEAACVEASTSRFTANLMAETAPACYLPLLLQLINEQAAPKHVRVRTCTLAYLFGTCCLV